MKRNLLALAIVCIAALFAVGTSDSGSSRRSSAPSKPQSEWIKPSSHFYTGLKLYVGTEDGSKQLVGTVLGGNDKYVDPRTGEKYRAVIISFESGNVEWRRRNDIGMGPTWWARRDDPAIERGAWKIYNP